MKSARFSVVALILGTLTAMAEEKPGIPKQALDEMGYRVGEWRSEFFLDGVKQGGVLPETTSWTPEKYCIIMHTVVRDDNVTFPATGITGWNAETKGLVEHWYGADGTYATFRYSLDVKKDAWVGTAKWVFPDGRIEEGKSVVDKKSPDEWEWNASFTRNGTKHTYRSINRRVK